MVNNRFYKAAVFMLCMPPLVFLLFFSWQKAYTWLISLDSSDWSKWEKILIIDTLPILICITIWLALFVLLNWIFGGRKDGNGD